MMRLFTFSWFKALRQFLMAALLCAPFAVGAAEFAISVADVAAPSFALHGIRLVWSEAGLMEINVTQMRVEKREFSKVKLRCARLLWQGQEVSCRDGSLDLLPGVHFELNYHLAQQRVQLTMTAADNERWQLVGQFKGGAWQVAVQLQNAQLKRFASLLPKTLPAVGQGALNGTIQASGKSSIVTDAQVDVQFANLAFSDESGLHAGEKLAGAVKLTAQQQNKMWQWQGDVVWQQGEVFWQPLYLKTGKTGVYQFHAQGGFDGVMLQVADAVMTLPEVGQVRLVAQWDSQKKSLVDASVQGDNVSLDSLFSQYALPFLDKSVLAEATVTGHADVAWQYRQGKTQAVRLNLRDGGIVDGAKRFNLAGIHSSVNWLVDTPSVATLSFASGEVMGVPLGAVQWEMAMQGLQFNIAQAELPILGGALVVKDFELHRGEKDWHWQFAGAIKPISMEKLSAVAKLPKMLGTLSGMIPLVRYENNQINVGGALLLQVFDGTVVVSQLKFGDPFGRAPRVEANLNMRHLDLDLLTRTFSFGSVQGLIDVDVDNLIIQSWQALQFDARIVSSAGNYRKRISQKAVQNISSLGGSGAVAAIQRGVVGFFDTFGYDKIVWTCSLQNDVCYMGGVESTPSGVYTIIKGGGIPAITVMGYNRNVSWSELITRLKRVAQDNRQVIVK
ncbi:MAG: hypothetical protein PHI11_00755 [Gallionella sp.]|nr:hypothetical protein [Gallionella sp.]